MWRPLLCGEGCGYLSLAAGKSLDDSLCPDIEGLVKNDLCIYNCVMLLDIVKCELCLVVLRVLLPVCLPVVASHIDYVLFPFLVRKFGIDYSAVDIALTISWIAGLVPNFIAMLRFSIAVLYRLSLVLLSVAFLLFFCTAFASAHLVLVLLTVALCLAVIGERLRDLAAYNAVLSIARTYKSLSVSMYDELNFVLHVVAPLIAPAILSVIHDVSLAYVVPLILTLLGFCLPLTDSSQVQGSENSSTSITPIRDRRLAPVILLFAFAYVSWFFVDAYVLIVLAKTGNFTPLQVAVYESVMALATIVSMPGVALICDKFRLRWQFVVISEVLAILYTLLLYRSVTMHDFAYLIATAMMSGLATSFWNTAYPPLIDELRGRYSVAQVLGSIGIVGRLVATPSIYLAGIVLEHSITLYFTITVILFTVIATLHSTLLLRLMRKTQQNKDLRQ